MDVPLAAIGLLLTTFAVGLPAAAPPHRCRSRLSVRPLAWMLACTGLLVTVTGLASASP